MSEKNDSLGGRVGESGCVPVDVTHMNGPQNCVVIDLLF